MQKMNLSYSNSGGMGSGSDDNTARTLPQQPQQPQRVGGRPRGRPRSKVKRIKVTFALPEWLIEALDEEAERRWPGKERMRTHAVELALRRAFTK